MYSDVPRSMGLAEERGRASGRFGGNPCQRRFRGRIGVRREIFLVRNIMRSLNIVVCCLLSLALTGMAQAEVVNVDFNGAGLLYFAAYSTIAETCERKLVMQDALVEGREWARCTSTVARDIFYYRNLNLGEELVVTLRHFTREGDRYLLHSELASKTDRAKLADVFTVKMAIG